MLGFNNVELTTDPFTFNLLVNDNLNKMQFTSHDRDNGLWTDGNCASTHDDAW